MSSGNAQERQERNEWEVAFGQIADVMKMVREGNRTPQSISPAMQAVMGDHIVTIQPRVKIVGDEKSFLITGEYTTAASVIAPYPVKWGCADGREGEIPLIIQPGAVRGRIVVLGRLVYNRELPMLLPNLMDPFNTLRFGVKFPEEQGQRTIGTVWRDATGGFWCVGLDARDGQPRVRVFPSVPDGGWEGDHVGFLVRE